MVGLRFTLLVVPPGGTVEVYESVSFGVTCYTDFDRKGSKFQTNFQPTETLPKGT